MPDSAINPLASLSEIAASLPRQPISSPSATTAPTSLKPAPIPIKQRRLSSAGQSRRRHSDATAAALTNAVVSRISYVSNQSLSISRRTQTLFILISLLLSSIILYAVHYRIAIDPFSNLNFVTVPLALQHCRPAWALHPPTPVLAVASLPVMKS
jgi:hypothetical protein